MSGVRIVFGHRVTSEQVRAILDRSRAGATVDSLSRMFHLPAEVIVRLTRHRSPERERSTAGAVRSTVPPRARVEPRVEPEPIATPTASQRFVPLNELTTQDLIGVLTRSIAQAEAQRAAKSGCDV
jgi:hypothetical protein